MADPGTRPPEPCGFAAGEHICASDSAWVIYVNHDRHVACDAHRNDVMFLFETKDVSAVFPIDAEGVDDAGT